MLFIFSLKIVTLYHSILSRPRLIRNDFTVNFQYVIYQIIKHDIEYSLFAQYQYYNMMYWLISLIITILIISPILDVHAVSREDINNMKDEINQAEKTSSKSSKK